MYNSTVKISQARFIACLGFTLVELMVTIVVLGIVASIAAPSISKQLANQRVKSTTATLVNVLKEARAESSINKIPVTVSYINGNQSNNMINVEVPYSGPNVLSSWTKPQDWTNLLMKSALAGAWPPSDSGSNNGGSNNGGSNNGGSNNGGSNNGGSNNGGSNNGGSNNGGSNNGGSNNGGSNNGGSNNGGSNNGGSNNGGSNNGGSNNGGGETEPNLVIIATHSYNVSSTISSSTKKITFKPNRTVSTAVTYTICDSNRSALPRQVIVNNVGLISSKLGGVCE
ncbi:pilus assembly FimT family protein [Psychrobacter celer]|uniref:pilus assembly FimT family protein n=1 Tax=Psychrobacter celer TaxID=306572 RepID=UPI003FD22444